MRIIFNRSGGIMGFNSSLTLNLDELPIDQAETLRLLLDKANFFTLTENPPTHPTPDSFHYTITVETDTITHTLHTSDTTAPDELHPLLQELSKRARRKPKI